MKRHSFKLRIVKGPSPSPIANSASTLEAMRHLLESVLPNEYFKFFCARPDRINWTVLFYHTGEAWRHTLLASSSIHNWHSFSVFSYPATNVQVTFTWVVLPFFFFFFFSVPFLLSDTFPVGSSVRFAMPCWLKSHDVVGETLHHVYKNLCMWPLFSLEVWLPLKELCAAFS